MTKLQIRNAPTLSRRPRWPIVAGHLALALLMLAEASGPALAYGVQTGGFSDGTDGRVMTFAEGISELIGPSLRLLTNSTVTAASAVVAGKPGYANTSTIETTTADFLSSSLARNVSVQGGSVSLAPFSAVINLSSDNGFGNATLNGTRITNGTAVLNATSTGSIASESIAVPPGGWGSLQAAAAVPTGASLTFSALYPNGSVAQATVEIGGVIDVDPILYVALRFQAVLGASPNGSSPSLSEIRIGQETGDRFLGAGVSRTSANVSGAPGGPKTLNISYSSFVHYSSNPTLPTVASTWYSGFVEHPNVIRVGNQWWAYFFGGSCYSCVSHIGRAVSSDLASWTYDSQPLLNGTAGTWTSGGVVFPTVIRDPLGTGYLMYFAASNATVRAIGLATSSDGLNWTEYSGNPVLLPSASGWDDYFVSDIGAVRYDNGTWTMWYNGGRSGAYPDWGVATSSDGRNWTKYASNPVLTRSAGADSVAISEGSVLVDQGTYYLYYTCGGSSWHICLAISANGYNWTKQGAVFAASGGWDGNDVTSPFPMIVNGTLIMFFSGWQPGTRVQSGRADATWTNGVVRGTFDFKTRRPYSLDQFSYEGTAPAGAGLDVYLRSSPDGSNWTAFESRASQSQSIATPADRFVEYLVYINGTVGAQPPTFSGVTLGYSTLAPRGRYESNAFTFADPISGARAQAALSASTGSLAIEFSTDNRTNWTRVANGTFAALPANSSTIFYALVLEGPSYGGPVVDAVTLLVQRKAYPSDVSARVGVNGTPFLSTSGVFDRALNVTIPAADLNAQIQAAIALGAGATTVDVPIVLTSTHFGVVALLEPRVFVALKNPLSASFQPLSASVTVDENSTASFTVDAQGYPDWNPINTSWELDGAIVASADGQHSFTYAPDFFAAGNHTLRCQVENGDFTLGQTWSILVRNVNRQPFFADVEPLTPLNASHGFPIVFHATGADADLDPLTYSWFVDGVAQNASSPDFEAPRMAVGDHLVEVYMADGESSVSHSWSVHSTNAIPVVLSRSPEGASEISFVDNITLAVNVVDADGDVLTYTWERDGNTIGTGGPTRTLDSFLRGPHSATVRISDGLSEAVVTFDIVVVNRAPSIIAFSPQTDQTISHLQSLSFAVGASDYESQPIRYVWSVGSNLLPSTTNSTVLDQLVPGSYVVTVEISDPFSSTRHSWNVTVVDRAPVIAGLSPAPGAIRTVPSTELLFTGRATDADGDAIQLSWYVDNRQVNGTNEARLRWDSPGVHNVTFEVSSSSFVQTVNWTVEVVVTNQPPVLKSFEPNETVLSIDTRAGKVFVVDVVDDGVLPLTVVWRLDGKAVANGTIFFFSPDSTQSGPHTLVVEVSDGEFSVTQGWNVEVSSPSPPVSTGGAADWLVPIAVIAGVAAVVVLQVLFRRRRSE